MAQGEQKSFKPCAARRLPQFTETLLWEVPLRIFLVAQGEEKKYFNPQAFGVLC